MLVDNGDDINGLLLAAVSMAFGLLLVLVSLFGIFGVKYGNAELLLVYSISLTVVIATQVVVGVILFKVSEPLTDDLGLSATISVIVLMVELLAMATVCCYQPYVASSSLSNLQDYAQDNGFYTID